VGSEEGRERPRNDFDASVSFSPNPPLQTSSTSSRLAGVANSTLRTRDSRKEKRTLDLSPLFGWKKRALPRLSLLTSKRLVKTSGPLVVALGGYQDTIGTIKRQSKRIVGLVRTRSL